MSDYSLSDVCLTWNDYPNFIFTDVLVGPEKSFVFKFSNCHNTHCNQVFESKFWDIYEVVSKGISKPAGIVMVAKGERAFCTDKAASSCRADNSRNYIESIVKTKPWSFNGLDLIRYEEAAEVITDLCTIMGVDPTVDLPNP